MISIKNVMSGYGDVTVLHDISFNVENEIFAVLGANGAGKSTLIKTITRLLPLKNGSIVYEGTDISHAQPHQVAGRGIGYVPQENKVFPDLTVCENLSIGSQMCRHLTKKQRAEKMTEIFDLFPDLKARSAQKAGSLSGGEAQMVAVGRALMQEPALILLDEPTTGLSPKYADLLFDKIKEIHETRKVSVILTEQNAEKAMSIADQVLIITLGRIHMLAKCSDVSTELVKDGYRI